MDYLHELEIRGIELQPTATGGMILYPFHDDHDKSLSVHGGKGYWHCFGCGESGAFFRLIAELDGIDERKARLKYYEEERIDALLDRLEHDLILDDRPIQKVKFNIDQFHERFIPITQSFKGFTYLQERKLKPRILNTFDVRWGQGKYKDRVIFPFYDTQGRLLSWMGRTVIPNHEPKMKNVHGVSLHDGLFGLYQLFHPYHHFPYLIVVEGPIDCIYLQQLGYPAVATLGTSGLSGAQLALLMRYTDKVWLSYDNDPAGRKATWGYTPKNGVVHRGDYDKLIDVMDVDTVVLPAGKDPNDLLPRRIHSLYQGVRQ